MSGTIRSWGSPQMAALLQRYEAGFRVLQPGVHFEDDLRNTLTAVPGVYTGRADVGLLGREVWSTEEQAFTATTGHGPTVVEIAGGAYDVPKATFALMVFVHRDNPLTGLTKQQLARAFAASERPVTWANLGVGGGRAHHAVHLYGFAKENDKAIVFRSMVFPGARWSAALREFNNAGTTDAGDLILRALAADPDGLAISNVHYAGPEVRALAVDGIAPTRENVAAQRYPLARSVLFVLNGRPAAGSALAEFVRYVLSRQGAEDVASEGEYLPLPAEVAAAQRRALQLETRPTTGDLP